MPRVFLSPAKVNLFLKVLGKRPDGYHELFTLMQPVSLYDEISVGLLKGQGITVESDSAEAPGGRDNLAYRAASLFFEAAGIKAGAEIFIKKQVPVGAGLGGGSSDAATTLLALNELTGAGLSEAKLIELGAALGSDVPFFILKGPALAKGRGEVLERIELPETHFVLVNPGFHVSTAWVYSSLGLTKKAEDNNLLYSYAAPAGLEGIVKCLSNDLEPVTAGKYNEISVLKQRLLDEGALGALMSGSGPTVFGVFGSGWDAERACASLKAKLAGGHKVFAAGGL